ncbi:hypothetical protein D3C76_1118730 [compost metagenome]
MVDGRQGNDRHRVTGQHERVGPGAAQQGRAGGTQRQPQGQGQQKQPRGLGEGADEQHRHDGSNQRAEQPRQALLHHHARQRLGDDECRHQGPGRLLKAPAQRQPQGQAAAKQGLEGKLHSGFVWRQQGLQRDGHGTHLERRCGKDSQNEARSSGLNY